MRNMKKVGQFLYAALWEILEKYGVLGIKEEDSF